MSHDSQLQQAVLSEFNWEPSIDAAHIGVTAQDGVVTLTGHVDNFASKHAAETAARRVKGVLAVAEEIEVRLPVETKRNDQEIAAAAIERLAWDVSVPSNAVQIKVEKGWVTLTGTVDWNFQKEAAADDIRCLLGVVGVSNQTVIKPRVNASNVSDDILHALHRSWFFDPEMVRVSSEGGKIRLSGTVHSPHDRQIAAATAWAAPGATAVENDIVII
jgi:osmotically-inducible protein OsmY